MTSSKSIFDLYINDMYNIPLLTANDEHMHAVLTKKGDKKSREILIRSNLRLVINIAKKHSTSTILEMEDLISEGNLGLIKAIDRFDPCMGTRISTYATYWINEFIVRAIADKSRSVRIPFGVIKDANECIREKMALTNKLQRKPTISEISDSLDKTPSHVERSLNARSSVFRLNDKTNPNQDDEYHDEYQDLLPAINTVDFGDAIDQSQIKDKILKSLKHLDDEHREVILMRYGLGQYEASTLDVVSIKLNLSREWVRQIQISALKKIKENIENIDDYRITA